MIVEVLWIVFFFLEDASQERATSGIDEPIIDLRKERLCEFKVKEKARSEYSCANDNAGKL